MKPAPKHEFSASQHATIRKAVRLEWLTLAYLSSVVVLMYMVMGSSQAMKTAWVEDMLSMVPPIMFLLTNHWRNKAPNNHFPYGYHRITSIGYLVSALALLVVGGYLIVDSLMKLVTAHHPTIGMQTYFGVDLWLGWWMILVLLWGTFPPVLLGVAKKKLAKPIYDKILNTDAKMNKADWLTAVAAIGGVLGIGLGLWWADAIAALFISYDIIRDGYTQSRDAVTGLMNRAPKELDGSYSDLPNRVIAALEELDWVDSAEVRLREEGHLIFGEGFYRSRQDKPVSNEDLRNARKYITSLDWRLHSFALSADLSDYEKQDY